MLRERSPLFRVWFVLFLGAVAPGVMTLLGHPARELFSFDNLLELIRVSIMGAFAALIALFVEKPRDPSRRTRAEDSDDLSDSGPDNRRRAPVPLERPGPDGP